MEGGCRRSANTVADDALISSLSCDVFVRSGLGPGAHRHDERTVPITRLGSRRASPVLLREHGRPRVGRFDGSVRRLEQLLPPGPGGRACAVAQRRGTGGHAGSVDACVRRCSEAAALGSSPRRPRPPPSGVGHRAKRPAWQPRRRGSARGSAVGHPSGARSCERCGYGAPGFASGAVDLAHRRFLRATRSNGPRAPASACGGRGVRLGGAGDSSRRGDPVVCGEAYDRRWRKPSALGAAHHAPPCPSGLSAQPVPARFHWPSAPFVPVPDVIAHTPVRGGVRCWRLAARHPPCGASAPGGAFAECGGRPGFGRGCRPGPTVRFAAPAVAACAGGAPDAVQPGTPVSGTARPTGWEPDGRRRRAFAEEQSTDVRTAGAQRADGRFAGPGARRSLAGRPPRSPGWATLPGTHGPRAAGSTRCPLPVRRGRAAHPTDRVRSRVRRVVEPTSGFARRPAPSGAGHERGPDRRRRGRRAAGEAFPARDVRWHPGAGYDVMPLRAAQDERDAGGDTGSEGIERCDVLRHHQQAVSERLWTRAKGMEGRRDGLPHRRHPVG